MKTLIITDNETKALISMDEIIEVVEEAFREKGLNLAQMPPKSYLFFKKYDGDLRVMPSYLEKLDISAVKIVNVHPRNPESKGLPTVMATIVLVEPETGAPKAIMGGSYITAVRTGAAGGVATKYLARKNSKVIGMVGAGTQAKFQLAALISLYDSLEVRVSDRNKQVRNAFVSEMKSVYDKKISRIVPMENIKDAVEGADIVVTTTPSRGPIVMDEWISEGTHLNCIGADAPGKEEVHPNILKRAKIVIDDWEQASHSGEINVPLEKSLIRKEDIWGSLGEIIVGSKAGRTTEKEITVFDSTGLAIQDAVAANIVYRKAISMNIGLSVELV